MIIFLWTHPRSVSTAFERIMAERGDMHIIHEPFSTLYYEIEKKAAAVGYQPAGSPKDYRGIKQQILKADEVHPYVFVKDMAYFCLHHLNHDHEWLLNARHLFLVREPKAAIASHYAINKEVTQEEIGYEALWDMYTWMTGTLQLKPLLILSEEFKNDPADNMQTVCRYCGIPFMQEALEWKKPPPEGWKTWEAWHKDAAQSNRIENKQKNYEHTVDNHSDLKAFYDHHLPYYQRLKAAAENQVHHE